MASTRRWRTLLHRDDGSASGFDELERQLVWMVGSPRTGSTWLANLLALHGQVRVIDEPLIGAHLGLPVVAMLGAQPGAAQTSQTRVYDRFVGHDDYFFSARYRDAWAPGLRSLVLNRLGIQARDRGRAAGDTLVVKEPHGSEGIDLLAGVLPESRLLALVRDGRDTLDSMLDAVRPGSWADDVATLSDSPTVRTAFVDDYARLWVHRTEVVLAALKSRDERLALLVRYEDLLDDTEGGLRRIYTWLGLAHPAELSEHVRKLAFSSLPPEHRGSGQFARAATPGLWRENLSPDEQRQVTELMAPALIDLGYAL